ncbi:hypothetical protein F2P81_016072 [Scophthalmus maximus]|uniref:Matrin-type domain-containing protein n=1 Tax=Scophthalmus maximus TaxID=52904 RepID=A0A6A4SE74_SCOMX|nr:hypothetical protein F2P81_016072 [Scophthalmus maximus]
MSPITTTRRSVGLLLCFVIFIAQRALPGPPQTANSARMVNLCQATQTTILAPNPMLQGALLMQQMQGNAMRNFGMGGQQFRQFFTAGSRSSLLGPVPMGMAINSPIMGFPAARSFHPHARYYNNNNNNTNNSIPTTAPSSFSSSTITDVVARQPDRKHDSEQVAAGSTTEEPAEKTESDCAILGEGGSTGESDVVEMLEESRAEEMHSCLSAPSPSGRLSEDDQQVNLPPEEMLQGKDDSLGSAGDQEEGEEGVAEGANKFYCYLCSITCHNQQNFRSHMNSVSHQQRMMEIQHMSNACLVTLLPRVQESLQGANKDGEKKADLKHWCATCHTHFTSSIMDHRRTEEHKLASRAAISSCTVCKKHFRTAQIFVEHLQSQEHKQKMEKDGCSAVKEVTLKNMTSDEQYDPDTVYGSNFLVPVAGFICRLCNKFYHFESSSLHTHCKSLMHFENLKRHRASHSQKGKAAESSRECLLATDGLRPVTESTTDLSEENSLSDDTGAVINVNSMQPKIALARLEMQTEDRQRENESEPNPASQDACTTSATCAGSTDQDLGLRSQEEETPSQASVLQESPAELPAGGREEPDSEPAAAVEDANEEEEEEGEAPVRPGKKNSTRKEKSTAKRRGGAF